MEQKQTQDASHLRLHLTHVKSANCIFRTCASLAHVKTHGLEVFYAM